MNPSDHPLAAALQGADLIHDSATLDAAISRMAAEIDRSLDASGQCWTTSAGLRNSTGTPFCRASAAV